MQRCPKCGRTYDSDTQKFCTHDGGRLAHASAPPPDQGPTAYDLNQTVRTDPFDPEATVTRLPDLNKTVMSNPTTEIRRETGPAVQPPPQQQQPAENPYQPQPPQGQQPPQQPPHVNATVAFNQPPPMPQPPPPPQQYYQPQQPAPPSQYEPAPPTQYAPTPPTQYAPSPPVGVPQEQQQHAPQAHHAPAAPARKGSKAPLIIGLVLILLLGGAAAWYFLIYKKGQGAANSNVANTNTAANSNANTAANTNANSNTTANTNTNPPEATPPPNSTRFVSSSYGLDGKLAENYTDFSFYYPNTWEKDPKSGVAGASNFVKLERRLPPDFTQENFAVTFYESKGTYDSDQGDVFPKLVDAAKAQYGKALPEFEVLSEGETEVNGIKGYELRFQSVSRGTEKGDITLWGRLVFLPPGEEDKTRGLKLLMITTSLAPELTGADDVGVKGELPVILNSFKFGEKK